MPTYSQVNLILAFLLKAPWNIRIIKLPMTGSTVDEAGADSQVLHPAIQCQHIVSYFSISPEGTMEHKNNKTTYD